MLHVYFPKRILIRALQKCKPLTIAMNYIYILLMSRRASRYSRKVAREILPPHIYKFDKKINSRSA